MLNKIKINTLFSICLSIITVTSFLFLFYVSIGNINEAESFTENNALRNISLLVDKIFKEDIKGEASVINKELQEVVDQERHISLLLNMSGELNLNRKLSNGKLMLDSETGLYKYFDQKNKNTMHYEGFGDADCGFFALYCNPDNLPPGKNINKNFYNFSKLIPILNEVFNSSKTILGISAYYFNGLYLSYVLSPEYNFKFLNNREHLINVKSNFRELLGDKDKPVFKLVRNSGEDKFTVIVVFFPIKNADKEISGCLLLIASYDILISNLTKALIPEAYRNYETIRIVVDEEGHIAYLPEDRYALFSIPLDKTGLKIQNPEGDEQLIKTKLEDSDNPAVRNMGEQLLSQDSGKFEIELKKDKYIAIYETLPVNNWKVILLVKKNDLYKPLIKTENKFKTIYRHIYQNYLITFLVVLIVGFAASYFIFKKLFIAPIENLRRDAAKLGEGEFDANVSEFGLKEIHELSRTFNNLGGQLKNYTENLKAEIKSRQTIETELKIAGDLQRSVLPKINNDFKTKSFELYAKLVPAKEMSGDFFDFFYLNDSKTLVLVLADVSGKGIRAAFYMSMAKAIVRETCLSSKNNVTPGEILKKVNNILCDNNDSCMFLTAYLIFYNIESGDFLYSNAGHHSFVCVDEFTNVKLAGKNNDPALGIIENADFSTSEYKLEKNEVLLIFTDGIIEAPDKDGNEYGMNRIVNIYKSQYTGQIGKIGDFIIEDVLEYQNSVKFDDATVLMLKRTN